MVEFTEYKGNKMIVLRKTEADRFPFQFGISKAKIIIENYEAIKKFAEGEEAKSEGAK